MEGLCGGVGAEGLDLAGLEVLLRVVNFDLIFDDGLWKGRPR